MEAPFSMLATEIRRITPLQACKKAAPGALPVLILCFHALSVNMTLYPDYANHLALAAR
jgi:hypothetical protein